MPESHLRVPAQLPAEVAGSVRAWLDGFAQAVRDRDYAAGRAYFAEHVVAYGTRGDVMVGLGELEGEQWRGVWERTEAFAFTGSRVLTWTRADDRVLVAVAAEWASNAVDRSGTVRPREGRATLLLEGASPPDAGLQCLHSHFSLNPTEWRGHG